MSRNRRQKPPFPPVNRRWRATFILDNRAANAGGATAKVGPPAALEEVRGVWRVQDVQNHPQTLGSDGFGI